MKNRGQMQLSFGMIFSIFLIIIFFAFAFYAIKNFVNIGKDAQISKFANDLQTDVDRVWRSSKSSQEETYSLPDKITSVCFRNNEFENLIFSSEEFIAPKNIEHLDIGTMTASGNYCIDNLDGKVKLILKKDFGETLVTITE